MGNKKKFLQILYQILEVNNLLHYKNNEHQAIIQWSQNGQQILLVSPQAFEETILPQYFKTMKIKSFYRQLSVYGFSVKQNNKKGKLFQHCQFFRGNYQSLHQIQRMSKNPIQAKLQNESVEELRKQTQDQMKTLDNLAKQQQNMFQQLQKHAQFQIHIFNSIQILHTKVKEQCGQSEEYHCDDFFNFMVKIFKGFQSDIAEAIFEDLSVFTGPETPKISPSPLIFHHRI